MIPDGFQVALGISVPDYWGRLMCKIVGHRTGEKLLMTAKMLDSDEALRVGLLDEIVSKPDLIPHARALMETALKLPDNGLVTTKKTLRSEFSQGWAACTPEEAKMIWSFLTLPSTSRNLEKYMEQLAKGRSRM